jgi:hypothetical protein
MGGVHLQMWLFHRTFIALFFHLLDQIEVVTAYLLKCLHEPLQVVLHQDLICVLTHRFVVEQLHHVDLTLQIAGLYLAYCSDHLEAFPMIESVVDFDRSRL